LRHFLYDFVVELLIIASFITVALCKSTNNRIVRHFLCHFAITLLTIASSGTSFITVDLTLKVVLEPSAPIDASTGSTYSLVSANGAMLVICIS
jgi:hypothetical protein